MDQLHLIISVRGYLPKHMIESFYQCPDFYSRRLPEPKHVPLERHLPTLFKGRSSSSRYHQLQDFIEKCLTLDPAYRPGAAHLLYTDYFSQDEFTKRKPILQEKIKRFNQPNCKESRKEKSSSTTKLRNNNAFQMKHEVKSMPEIQTAKNTVYIKNKKSNLTKLP